MEILSPIIPVPRNGKLGWYQRFKQQFLLQESPAKVILIGDSLISNKEYQNIKQVKYGKIIFQYIIC